MCGICGVIGINRTEQAEAITRRMMDAIWHRGPDEDGLLLAPSAALGMRRLSIIDLPGGHQPVFNEDGKVAIVFNGEIYNFQALRASLENRGHSFRTRSDTEVIVHAYEEWGEHCVDQLQGMFAFAIWDARASGVSGDAARQARIFLARDRFGIKPLYYGYSDGALLFASEVRALLASGCIPPRIAPDSLEGYLLFGSVFEPSTLIEGVYSLPPGHCVSLTAAAPPAKLQPKPYWDFSAAALDRSTPGPKSFAEAAKQLRPLLEETVRSHLIADVPLGLFLSSGLDSTALVALASQVQSNLHTFTVVFPQQQFSEGKVARATAKHFKTNHQEMLLSPDEVLVQLGDALSALDQPTMDGVNTYFVSRAAQQAGLKVALSGLGGDEVFGGYPTFATTPRITRVASIGRWVPSPLRQVTASAAVKLGRSDAVRKAASAWRSPREFPHAFFFTRTLFTPSRVQRLLDPYFQAIEQETAAPPASPWRRHMSEIARQANRLDGFTGVSCLEMESYMVNTLLRDTDSVSMANSLEVRVPLLDHRLVEFVARLPMNAKYRKGVVKALLAEALSDLLPDNVGQGPKRTFTLPWELWMRGALGVRVAHDLMNISAPLQPYLNPRALRGTWQNFVIGQTSWSRPWSLYVLNDWVRRNIVAPQRSTEMPAPHAQVAVAGDPANLRS